MVFREVQLRAEIQSAFLDFWDMELKRLLGIGK